MRNKENKTISKQVNRNFSKLARIDAGLHRLAKIKSSRLSITIKEYLEGLISDDLADETVGETISS